MTISTKAALSPPLKRRTSSASCTASCPEMTARLVGSVAGREDSKRPDTEVKEIMVKALEWCGDCELAVPRARNATSSPNRKFLLHWKRVVDRKTPQGF